MSLNIEKENLPFLFVQIGGKNDRNKTDCQSLSVKSQQVRQCKFEKFGSPDFECKLEEFEGYSYNVWRVIIYFSYFWCSAFVSPFTKVGLYRES